jgi:hypothetical protein
MPHRVTPGARHSHVCRTAALVIVLWVAFALRVAWLDRQPLWWDEGLVFSLRTRIYLTWSTRR